VLIAQVIATIGWAIESMKTTQVYLHANLELKEKALVKPNR